MNTAAVKLGILALQDKLQFIDRWQQARGELLGGIAGAVSSLPQSIAYGVIAFAPLATDYALCGALAGVYSSIVGGLVSCLAGSSQIMVSGSRAATAVIFAALLTQLLNLGAMQPGEMLALAFVAILLSGVMQLLLGLIKVGHLVKYVPQTVIAGFLNGSGLLILAGQVRPLTGFDLPTLLTLSNFSGVQWGALLLGLGTALLMILAPRVWKNAPAGLLALVLGSTVYHAIHSLFGLAWPMGDVFPSVNARALPASNDMADMVDLLISGRFVEWLPLLVPAALSIAVISSLDSLLSAAALDNLTLGRTNGNRELMGQGLGNIATALLGGTPSSGSMGRSGALFRAGGRYRWSVVVNVLLLAGILIGLAPLIGWIPKAVVAGVLLVIGTQLFDEWTIHLVRTELRDRKLANFQADLLVIACVVAATLIWNLITAVGLGIVLAVIIFVRRMSRSIIRRRYRGNHVHSRQLRDDRVAELLDKHGRRIVVLELEGALFFGSADGLEMEIDKLASEGGDYFILDIKRIKDIDSSGAFILQRINQRLTKAGKLLVFSYVDKERRVSGGNRSTHLNVERRQRGQERHLWRILRNLGLIDNLGEAAFLPDTDTALGVCESYLLQELSHDGVPVEGFNVLESGIFCTLTEDELRQVRQSLKSVDYSVGTVIFRQGEPGDALYLLIKGVADVVIDIPGGRQKRVQTLFPGAVFGEMALMDGEPRAANIVVNEDASCLKLTREDFETLMAESPQIALKLFARIGVLFARRLRSANMMIMELEA